MPPLEVNGEATEMIVLFFAIPRIWDAAAVFVKL